MPSLHHNSLMLTHNSHPRFIWPQVLDAKETETSVELPKKKIKYVYTTEKSETIFQNVGNIFDSKKDVHTDHT